MKQALSKLQGYSEELNLDLNKPEDRFKWFLASILFGKRISAETAKKTYLYFEKEELTSADAILQAGWDRLVEVLDLGGYTRYDFSTATNLLEIARRLKEKYGSLEKLYLESISPTDLENRLQEFKGVGPVAVNIFLRELRLVWEKAKPRPSPVAVVTAERIGLDPEDVEGYESQLVRLNLEYCKKQRNSECPLGSICQDAVLFPRRINGKYVMLHRFDPDICVAYSADLETWCNIRSIFGPRMKSWDSWKIGAGGPPIEVNEGWLMIYHGVSFEKVYSLGVVLLDKNDPEMVLSF